MSIQEAMTSPIASTASAPLQGWRIVITRSEEQSDSLSQRLQELGAEPVIYPTIAFAPPEDLQPLDTALQQLLSGEYDWMMLTSVNAVKAVHQRLIELAPQHPTLESVDCKLAAVGPTTTAACEELLHIQPAIVPKKFVAEALAEAMGDMHGQRVLLANADIARPVLQERLREAGAIIDRVVAYRTVPATGGVDMPALLHAGEVDAITFTSGSTARYFVDRIGSEALVEAQNKVIACIGPIAAEGAAAVGLPATIVAQTYTEEGLVEALVEYVTTHPKAV
jgi:uroporphyrinogen-III synthase